MDLPKQVLIKEKFNFSVIFNNSSADIGFESCIDLYLPRSGADDSLNGEKENGIAYTSIDYLGNNIHTWEFACKESTTVTHPLTELSVTCPNAPADTQSPFICNCLLSNCLSAVL